ncbi:MAG: glycoside hydrolase family 57 protein, partial [Nitrospirota bacterium]
MKKDKPLYINFIWHMHQPYYKDPETGDYVLPWVRLHGIKDYYDMVAILRDFPEIKATFNIVPSLLSQIKDYVENGATDRCLIHTLVPADSLDLENKVFILNNFFLANWDNMIKIYSRYNELLSKRGYNVVKGEIERISRYFSTQDFLDLQVWFNLAWFDPLFKDKDPFLSYLIKKGRDFTEEEKSGLIEKQKEILSLIIPEYRKAESSAQIELSTSPFYHPILPLLCDTNIAKASMPDINLPKIRFSHSEDAVEHINRAVAYHYEIFGKKPKGMWPSEGAVSESIIPIAVNAGIEWIATDEDILSRSLGINIEKDPFGGVKKPDILYKPYRLSGGEIKKLTISPPKGGVSIFFRDHTLSDLIGFVYSKWDYRNAVEDFIFRLHKTHK